MTNGDIAAALEELGVLYELDGAVRYRVLAYSTAAKAIRESPVSVEELARAGRATEIPGVGKTLAEKIDALLDTGEIPAAAKLKAKFPATLVEVTRVPGIGPKTARLLWEELQIATLEDLKKAAEEEKIRDVKGLGPKAEENVLASLERVGQPGEGPGAPAALDRAADRRGARRGAARAPGRAPGRGRRLGPPLGRHQQGHRHHRHRREAEGAGRIPRRPRAGRRRRQTERQRPPRADPQRHLGRPADRPARRLRQPAPALHRLPGPQHPAARGRGEARPLGLRARDHRHRDRRGDHLRDRARGLQAPRLRVHRAGAAGGARRAEGGARREAAEAGRARRRARRPPRPHDALRRAQLARRDGGGGPRARLRLHGDHRPLGQPRLRRRRPARSAAAADRGGRGLERRARQPPLPPPGRLGDQHRPRRHARLSRGPGRRTRLGRWPASTPPSTSPKRT